MTLWNENQSEKKKIRRINLLPMCQKLVKWRRPFLSCDSLEPNVSHAFKWLVDLNIILKIVDLFFMIRCPLTHTFMSTFIVKLMLPTPNADTPAFQHAPPSKALIIEGLFLPSSKFYEYQSFGFSHHSFAKPSFCHVFLNFDWIDLSSARLRNPRVLRFSPYMSHKAWLHCDALNFHDIDCANLK